MLSILIYLCILCWVIFRLLSRRKNVGAKGAGVSGSQRSNRQAKALDGHVLTGEKDITCRQFGHRHSLKEEPEMRFLVHDEPEQGFILLNGIKMRITEADKYENRI